MSSSTVTDPICTVVTSTKTKDGWRGVSSGNCERCRCWGGGESATTHGCFSCLLASSVETLIDYIAN